MLSTHRTGIGAVLLDLHMPKMSGVEAAGVIRNDPSLDCRHLPVIALTADVRWHDPRKVEDHGFDGVLEKPLKLDTLRTTLSALEI